MKPKAPVDFVIALKASPLAWERYQELSPSHRRQHIDAILAAVKPETRARRIAAAVRRIETHPVRKKAATV